MDDFASNKTKDGVANKTNYTGQGEVLGVTQHEEAALALPSMDDFK